MIEATAGNLFEAAVAGYPSGRYGFIGVAIEDGEGNVISERRTSGIIESPLGIYNVTLLAPMTPGEYKVAWDNDGNNPTAEDLTVVLSAVAGLVPSLEDVAILIRARTRDINGADLGTFTPNTVPTDEQVADMITRAVRDVTRETGRTVPEGSVLHVRDAVALRTAMLIERSYFPEQMRTDRTLYDALLEEFNTAITSVKESVTEERAGGEAGTGDEPGMPASSFPVDAGGVIGWGTRW